MVYQGQIIHIQPTGPSMWLQNNTSIALKDLFVFISEISTETGFGVTCILLISAKITPVWFVAITILALLDFYISVKYDYYYYSLTK